MGRYFETEASQVSLVVKNPLINAGNLRDADSIPGLGRYPGGRLKTHSDVLAWRAHEQRSLEKYCPWGHNKLEMTRSLTCAHAL